MLFFKKKRFVRGSVVWLAVISLHSPQIGGKKKRKQNNIYYDSEPVIVLQSVCPCGEAVE